MRLYRYFCKPHQIPHSGRSSQPDSAPNTDGDWEWAREGLYLTLGISSPLLSCNDSPNVRLSNDRPVQAAYGGILVRALRDVATGETTKEPLFVLAKLLHGIGSRRLSNRVDELWGRDTRALIEESPGRLFLRPISVSSPSASSASSKSEKSLMNNPTIYTCPRVNIDISSIAHPSDATFSHPRVQYLIRPYRFIRYPQLFAFPSAQITYGLITSGLSCPEIAALLNVGLSEVEIMVMYLEEGRNKGRSGLKGLVGREGKQAAVTVPGYMNLAGIVESILREGDRRVQLQEGKRSSSAVAKVVPTEMVSTICFAHGTTNMQLLSAPSVGLPNVRLSLDARVY